MPVDREQKHTSQMRLLSAHLYACLIGSHLSDTIADWTKALQVESDCALVAFPLISRHDAALDALKPPKQNAVAMRDLLYKYAGPRPMQC